MKSLSRTFLSPNSGSSEGRSRWTLGCRSGTVAPALAFAAFLASGCGDVREHDPDPDRAGFGLEMEVTVAPGEEAWKCQIGELPIDGPRYVHAVEHEQTHGMHHMDVMILLWSGVNLPPGLYDCGPLYAENPRLMEETTLYASQSPTGDIVLPPGTVAEIPGPLTVMHEIHYVNTTDAPQRVFSRIRAKTIPPTEVTQTIWGIAVRDTHLEIPAGSRHVEWTRCEFDADVDILFLSSHTHELGRLVEIFRWDGVATGESVYRNTDWQTPVLAAFDRAPLHVAAGQGLEFRCEFENDRDQPVGWGFGAQDEMCQIAVVFTPGDPGIECTIVDTSDGVIPSE